MILLIKNSMKKVGFSFLIILFCLFSLSATNSIEVGMTLPQKALFAFDTYDFQFTEKEIKPYLGFGYSFRHYNENHSNALVYGPCLKGGIGFDITDSVKAGIGFNILYANFPTVLWFEAEASKMLSNKVKISLSVLKAKKDISFKIAAGLVYEKNR